MCTMRVKFPEVILFVFLRNCVRCSSARGVNTFEDQLRNFDAAMRPGGRHRSSGHDHAINANLRDACPGTLDNPDRKQFKMKPMYTDRDKEINCCGCNPNFKYIHRCNTSHPSSTHCEPCEEGTHIDKYAHFETICQPREGVGTDEDRNVAPTTTAVYINEVSAIPKAGESVSQLFPTTLPSSLVMSPESALPRDGNQMVPALHPIVTGLFYGGPCLLLLLLACICYKCWSKHHAANKNDSGRHPKVRYQAGRSGNDVVENTGDSLSIDIPETAIKSEKQCACAWCGFKQKVFDVTTRKKKRRNGIEKDPTSSSAELLRPASSNSNSRTAAHSSTSHSGAVDLSVPTALNSAASTSTALQPSTSVSLVEREKINAACEYISKSSLTFLHDDTDRFCDKYKISAPPRDCSKETEQQRFSKAIQNGVEANCISSLDVVDYFDDREMLTVVYDLLRRFYEVERYMMRTPKTGTNLATSQS